MIRLSPTRAFVIAAMSFAPLAAMAQIPAAAPPAKPAAATAPTAPPAMADTALPKDATQRLEQHNKQLHDQLGITAEQQPQWDQFTQVMRGNANDMRRAFTARGDKLPTMNASENMQSYADLAQVHAANMQKAAASFQTLYAVLTPEQKAAADRLFRSQMERPMAKR
jgi:periplasmic protein CpxP/Spy